MSRLLLCLPILSLAACANHATPPLPDPAPSAPDTTVTTRSIDTVLAAHTDSLMAYEGVTGVGQALCEGHPCIRVYVLARTPELEDRLPDVVEGYSVEIVETGQVRPLPTDGPR